MSAPASAWDTAVFASNSSVASLSTYAPSRTPQCPWSVYSHRHTSVTTASPGTAALMARTASCTTPFGAYACVPTPSLSFGSPNSSTAGMPSDATSRASSASAETGN